MAEVEGLAVEVDLEAPAEEVTADLVVEVSEAPPGADLEEQEDQEVVEVMVED